MVSAGVEALNLAKWPIGAGQEQAVMASLGHHMARLSQLDLADSLVSALPCKPASLQPPSHSLAAALSCLIGSAVVQCYIVVAVSVPQ